MSKSISISGLLAPPVPSLGYIRQKENLGNSLLCYSSDPEVSSHSAFSSPLFLCLIYKYQTYNKIIYICIFIPYIKLFLVKEIKKSMSTTSSQKNKSLQRS